MLIYALVLKAHADKTSRCQHDGMGYKVLPLQALYHLRETLARAGQLSSAMILMQMLFDLQSRDAEHPLP